MREISFLMPSFFVNSVNSLKRFNKKLLLTFLGFAVAYVSQAATIFSNNVTGNWSSPASWSTNTVPGIGDVAIIAQGTITVDIATIAGAVQINGGTLKLSAGLTITNAWEYNSGTFTPNTQTVTFATGSSIGGTLATSFRNVKISTTNPTDVVPLLTSVMNIQNSSGGGILTLERGIFKIGTGNVVNMIGGGGGNTINNPNAVGTSDLATTGTNGSDGGTIIFTSGNPVTVNGPGKTTFYNLTATSNPSFTISTAGTVLINGRVNIRTGSTGLHFSGSNAPIYGPASLLYIDYANQGYNPGLEWSASSGTIGVTAGYPNDLTLTNIGTSQGGFNNGNGWVPNSTLGINGVFTLGDNVTNAQVDFSNVPSFTCAGFVLNQNSRFIAPKATMTVTGNWTDNQAVSGTNKGFFTNGTSTVIFSGTALCSAPNTITPPAGNAETFNNLTINNHISLLGPVTVNSTGTLTLSSGIVSTTASNILTINNTSASAISGGSATAFINGPIARSLGTAANNYAFPVGSGTCTPTYLPFTINKPASNATVATIQAFNTSSGGTQDASITTLSTTEYWSMITTVPFTNGANVSVSRTISLGSFNMVAMSQTSASGTYTAIGGTVGTNDITNAGTIGNNSPWYFALANGPLIARIVNVVTPKCAGTVGSVTVGGSGGTAPYQYATETGAFSSNNLFENLVAGKYIFRVKDAVGAIATATVILKPLSTIADTTICSGSVTLTTSGAFSYSWTSSPAGFTSIESSPTVSPTVNTTYYVNALILDNSVNIIPNGDFELGATGFASDYINLTGNGQIPYNAANQVGAVGTINHKGIYAIVTASNGLCNFFSPAFYDHTTGSGKMMVIDGPNDGVAGQFAWSNTVSVIPGNSYVLSYYLNNAGNSSPSANVQTLINGTAVASTTGFSANPFSSPVGDRTWKKVSYFWTAPTGITSATISLIDLITNADVGNDFAIDDITMYNTCTVTDSVKVNVGSSTAPTVTSPVTYCQNATAVPLTAVGTNLKWYDNNNQLLASAPTPSTTTVGSTNYYVTETPLGGCGESPKATIVVNITLPNTLPTFTAIAPICAGTTLSPLPTTSTNNIIGTWAPALDNTATKTYTFTPAAGQCATSTTLQIVVNQVVVPTFTPVAAICSGAALSPLPLTSTNNVTGTWSPALDNTATKTYTFTPTPGQCASTATLQIVVNQSTTPTFAPVAAICAGETLNSLPTTSTNNITGTWSPALDNTGTRTYTFTPTAGQCAATTTLTITVNPLPNVNAGPNLSVVQNTPITITGTSTSEATFTWSPGNGLTTTNGLVTQAQLSQVGQNVYRLTATAGNCSAFDEMTLTVTSALPCLDPMKGFTPNGDGFNEKWIVFNDEGCFAKVQVDVYNRYGGLVYHSDKYTNNWNGEYKGKPIPDATYYYVIKATDGTGHTQIKTGNVTVIR